MFILAEEFRAEWLWSGEESSLAVYGLDWSWADMTRAGDENKRNIRQHERSGDGHRTEVLISALGRQISVNLCTRPSAAAPQI